MLNQNLLSKLAEYIIAKEEKSGTHPGGSGHLADVGVSAECIMQEEPDKDTTKVTIIYKKTVVSEFTIYPDNPPYESLYRKTVTTDNRGNIISETEKEYVTTEELWDCVQRAVRLVVEYVLLRIEWMYGDNRAPLRFPPSFSVSEGGSGEKIYTCIVEHDFPDAEKMVYSSGNPGEVYRQASDDILRRFDPE